eukprot:scaffold456845_cov48-Prasinocladus_malaysianus.AAC.1
MPKSPGTTLLLARGDEAEKSIFSTYYFYSPLQWRIHIAKSGPTGLNVHSSKHTHSSHVLSSHVCAFYRLSADVAAS